MNALVKVIEKYSGVHRCSIVEYDIQNIYDLAMGIIWNEEFLSRDSLFLRMSTKRNCYRC